MTKDPPKHDEISALRTNVVLFTRRLRWSSPADQASWTALMALSAIQRGHGETTPATIAAEHSLRSSNVAAVLNDLQQRGLITRTADKDDKRKIRLSLTDQGLTLVEEARAERDEWLKSTMNACLSIEEQSQLITAGKLLARMTGWLATQSAL